MHVCSAQLLNELEALLPKTRLNYCSGIVDGMRAIGMVRHSTGTAVLRVYSKTHNRIRLASARSIT